MNVSSRWAHVSRSEAGCAGATRQLGEIVAEMSAEERRVATDAVEEDRLSGASEREAQHVEPRLRHHAAVVKNPTLAVQEGLVEPWVVGLEPSGPHDGRIVLQVDRRARRADDRRRRSIRIVIAGEVVDLVQQPTHLQVCIRADSRERTGELRTLVADSGKSSDQLDADITE